MEVMLRELMAPGGPLKEGGVVYLKTDGCAKQYKCAKAMYLMCKLATTLGVTIDQMLEVTGHGKDEADGHGGVFKSWLTGEMMRDDFETSDAPITDRRSKPTTGSTKRHFPKMTRPEHQIQDNCH